MATLMMQANVGTPWTPTPLRYVPGTALVLSAPCPTKHRYHVIRSPPPLRLQPLTVASQAKAEKNVFKKKTKCLANKRMSPTPAVPLRQDTNPRLLLGKAASPNPVVMDLERAVDQTFFYLDQLRHWSSRSVALNKSGWLHSIFISQVACSLVACLTLHDEEDASVAECQKTH
jgi:hypothetical protein